MRCTLSDREVSFVSQFIYRINQLNDYTSVCRTTLEELQSVIPYDKALIFQLVEQDGGLVYRNPVVCNTMPNDYDESIFMRGTYRSDWLTYTRAPWTSTFRQTDIRREDEFLQSALYRDVYAPQDIYYGVHSILVHSDHKLAQVGLFRSQRSPDFSDRDVFLLSTLSLHLELKLFQLLCPQSPPPSSTALAVDDFKFHLMQKFGVTRREAEVVLLLDLGKDSQEVCDALFISKSTLDKHLYSIYRKMDVKKRAQLVHLIHLEKQRFSLENKGASY